MTASSIKKEPVKRAFVIHDSVTIAVLVVVAALLYGMTSFLFRTFESHREELAIRWATRGKVALGTGKPDQAISAMRIALSYDADNHDYQLLLAEALAQAGPTHREEAINYFVNLWDTQPGDGMINLQLARLARAKGDARSAVDYYRAAIFGMWSGDGVQRRRDVRLELVDYLTERHEYAAARSELLIAAGNTEETESFDLVIAEKLKAAGDTVDAMSYYRKAIDLAPHHRVALSQAAQLAYDTGDFTAAVKFANRALSARPEKENSGPDQTALETLASNATQMLNLTVSTGLPDSVRIRHVRVASGFAQKRLASCTASATTAGNVDLSSLQPLEARWQEAEKLMKAPSQMSADDISLVTELVFDTERKTQQVCGAATGNDALLLQLANTHPASEQ